MPRKALIKTADFPYHITNRSNNKEFFYTPPSQLWQICREVLSEIEKQFGCQLHAFVLMSNHYHLIMSTPQSNIGDTMRYFHREIARKANRQAHRMNHFFGGRYKWSVIYEEAYYWSAVKYVFRNPVEAGLCDKVEDFPYSSLTDKCKSSNWLMVDYFKDRNKVVNLDVNWLNQSFTDEQSEAIANALRRRQFQLGKNKNGITVSLGNSSLFRPYLL